MGAGTVASALKQAATFLETRSVRADMRYADIDANEDNGHGYAKDDHGYAVAGVVTEAEPWDETQLRSSER